jgi:integrase
MQESVPESQKSGGRGRRDFGTVFSVRTPLGRKFRIRWWDSTGQRKQKSGFETKRDAQAELARIRLALGEPVAGSSTRRVENTVTAPITFAAAADSWMAKHSAVACRGSTHYENQLRLEKRLRPFFGPRLLSQITPDLILEFRAQLQEDGLAAKTTNQYLGQLRSILKAAVVSGHIPVSPTDKLGRGKFLLKVRRVEKAPLPVLDNPAQIGQILEAIREMRPDRYCMFAVLAYTGVRKGEVVALRRGDVDMTVGQIVVSHSYGEATKSGETRSIPIHEELRPILTRHFMEMQPATGDLLFPNERGEMFSRRARLHEILAKALKRIGLPRFRLHDVRHLFASHFVMSGGDLFTLSKLLGHASVEITAEVYAHITDRHRAEQMARMSFTGARSGNASGSQGHLSEVRGGRAR